MHKVLLHRLIQFPLILAVIYLLTFLLAWVAPGDPFANERNMDPVVVENLKRRFHAESAWQFLTFYPRNVLLRGDFGPSMQYREWSVNDIVEASLPVSVTLGLFALTIGLFLGVGVGTLAAVHRGGVLDWTSLSISLLGISLPSFVIAAVMVVFAAATKWMPVGGWGNLSDMVLPGIALSLAPMAYIARLTRVAMLDVLGADYVRTARAKGLSRNVVIWKHCLRNAVLPVLSYLGPAAAATLTGSFVVEKVFNIPGLGQHFVNSVINRDRTLILGVVMVYSLFLLSFNLLVDIAYAWVDPRIDLSGGAAAEGGAVSTMTVAVPPADVPSAADAAFPTAGRVRSSSPWALALRTGRVVVGGGVLLLVVLACLVTLPWTLDAEDNQPPVYARQSSDDVREPPAMKPYAAWFGYDGLGRSLLARCLLGGTISLAVGAAAAAISVVLGVTVGLVAGYRGGWVDAVLMRTVDVLYGLPYILLVILFKIAFETPLAEAFAWLQDATGWGFSPTYAANLVVLFSAIGLVSWLTMARVVRGQVLSLRSQPFIEACRAMGLPQWRIFMRHMLPNLVGPITVYATLTIPSAILQESFLSFLGVGVNPPLPTWGSLASDAVQSLSPVRVYWWQLLFPCLLLAVTLLSLNFLGDGLRDVFDPKREAAKI